MNPSRQLGTLQALGAFFLAMSASVLTVAWPSILRADESQWIQRSPTTPPSARWDASIVYDSNSDRLVLYGGRSSASNGTSYVTYGDVWIYTLSTRQWSSITPSGSAPAASSGHTAIYDSARDRMILYGGAITGVVALSLGASPAWSSVSTTGGPPASRENHVAIYDPVRDQMVIAGGLAETSTWKLTFSDNHWTNANASIPFGEHHGAAVYDAVNQRMLYFGGWSYSYGLLCDGPAIVASPYVFSLSLTGAASWTTVGTAPWSARGEITALWDSIRNRVLIYGGVGYYEACHHCICGLSRSQNEPPDGDVWAMSVSTNGWSQLSPTGGPPASRGHDVAAYDPTRDEVTMFGGGNYITDDSAINCLSVCYGTLVYTYRNDTWSLKPDVVAPATISLGGTGGCYDHIYLAWTAPGDDGTTGTATAYDLRWSSSAITEANFGSASYVAVGSPLTAGSAEQLTVWVPRCSGGRHYAIKARDEAGNWSPVSNSLYIGPGCPHAPAICFEESAHQPLSEPGDHLPGQVELAAPAPNPIASGSTLITYGVPATLEGCSFDLAVFDIVGRRVTTLDQGSARAGYHSISWDLRSEEGERVARGMYFVNLRLGSTTLARRIIAIH
jgi:Galactose oxidase, central domain